MAIIHIADLSLACLADACVECVDPDCLCLCHETDDLEPFDLDEEQR